MTCRHHLFSRKAKTILAEIITMRICYLKDGVKSMRLRNLRNLLLALAILVSMVYLTSYTYAADVEYTYNSVNRLMKTVYSDGTRITTIEYEYDDVGNMTKFTSISVTDTDNDGLPDYLENMGCTDPFDADSDDDGLLDGDEDADHDGVVADDETDPCDVDTDQDGIQDGTELAYTSDDIGPDTDTSVFQPDIDPTTTTDPLDDDTDDDGLLDGEEDANHNGKVDAGETDPCHSYLPIGLGQTTIDHNWKTVSLSNTHQDAIFILGPPTYHGTDPGVVRLQNVTNNSFDVRFQEWLYKDGSHTQENIPYLVISGDRYQMPDGSIWEAGTFSLSGTGIWTAHAFTSAFSSTPALFLTAQTYNGSDPITVRARNVTNTGFEAALFEEENKMDGHVTEEVGYLAVYSPQLSGTVNINGTDVPYLLQAQSVDHRFVPVLSSDIKLEEEQSKDSEVDHINETISILALGDKIFTQDISTNGGDTMAIRRLAPEYGAAMEWGTVDGVDHNWIQIPLAKEYLNPVVVAKPVSSLGGDPGVIRIRNVSHNSFELRYNEWLYKDGSHTQERVFYMVVEAGKRSVAGLTVEARKLNTSKLLADGWEPITFSASFSQTPNIFTSVQTCNGGDPVTTRLSDCTIAGFDLTMDEEEAKNDGHTTETISWIAIEKGTGKTNDNRSVVVLSDSTSHIPTQIDFGQSMARRFPVVVSDMITTYGADPGFLRYQNLGPGSIDLFIQEEASADAEMNHTTENVSLFVAE
jgi:hypothetical protein